MLINYSDQYSYDVYPKKKLILSCNLKKCIMSSACLCPIKPWTCDSVSSYSNFSLARFQWNWQHYNSTDISV